MEGSFADRVKNVRLTQTEKEIADYFLEHEQELYFSTSKALAQALGVSDTSVIRLCRSLGYKGFRDMQESIRADLSDTMRRSRYVTPQNQVSEKLCKSSERGSRQVLESALAGLENTYSRNRQEQFAEAAELILSSRHIYVAGFRGSAGVAAHMGVLLAQMVRHVKYSIRADSECVEAMLDYGPEDCVILFGAARYSKMSKTLAKMARERGCRSIVVTDRLTADIAAGAELVFLADYSSPSVFNSYIGALYIVETIGYEVGCRIGVETRRRLSQLNNCLSELQLY